MKSAPMVVVEQSLQQRIEVVIEDYIVDLGRRYLQLYGEDGAALHAAKMQDDLARIRKRLGGERHQRVSDIMAMAFELQWRTGDCEGHTEWISCLLAEYYDPMYEYQLERRAGDILYRGDRQGVIAWAQDGA